MVDDPTLVFPEKSRFRHETRDENVERKAQDKTKTKDQCSCSSLSRAVTLPASHAVCFLHMSAFC